MEPTSSVGLKLAIPALRTGFNAVGREWARRPGEEGALPGLAQLDDILDEAVAVLAREGETLLAAAGNRIKGLLSRPDVFDEPAARAWIATELAQDCLKEAALAALRGEDDSAFLDRAAAHYASFLEDDPDGSRADADEVILASLDFLLRSMRLHLTAGERMVLQRLDGLNDQLERIRPPDTSDLVDERIGQLVDRLRQIRFFRSVDTEAEAAIIATSVIEGRYSAATPAARSRALAWCARVTAFGDTDLARSWLAEAETLMLETSEEVVVARAMVAAEHDWQAALPMVVPASSPMQATATFLIIRRGLDDTGSLAAFAQMGLTPDMLDSDGRFALLSAQVQAADWPAALATVRSLESTDYDATPALMWLAATVLVASCLPEQLRSFALHDIPSSPHTVPLREGETALEARRIARDLMDALAERCDALGLPHQAAAARRYSLWLRLEDPEQPDAVAVLRERAVSPDTALAYLPLALAYGLDVDRTRAAREIDLRFTLESQPSPETMNALAGLLVDQAINDPKAAAGLLDKYRGALQECIEPRSLLALETRILVDAGDSDAARDLLENAPVELAESERAVLASLIESDGERPSLEALEALYKEDPQLNTLVQLVHRLHSTEVTPRYLELARELLSLMPTSEFAIGIIEFLVSQGHDEEAAEILSGLSELVDQSDTLLAHMAWLHYRRGALGDAASALARLEARRDDPQDRQLRLQLLIASGHWEALDGYLERQWEAREDRTAKELARYSQLAAQTGAQRVMDFARAAAAAAPDDPQILLSGYMAATTAGLEDERPEASNWLARAAELSGEDGPVQSAPLETLLAGRGDWEERTERASEALVAGGAPLDALARLVNRPWLELILTPLILNPEQRDQRKVQLRVPFSGKRPLGTVETPHANSIAIDASALVTLASVDALDVLDSFDRVYIPHDLLTDLFEQRSRLSFHQPSRIAFAKRLLDLVSNGTLTPFSPTRPPDIQLAAEIGASRAAMLAEAAARDECPTIYVHPYPIRVIGSLLSGPADLDAYTEHISSCLGVVDYLFDHGHITSDEAAKARNYLVRHDAHWPDEAVIEPGATLFLSDLSIDFLHSAGLLERIAAAGVTAVVSNSELDEARALRDNATLFEGADRILSRLRKKVAEGLADGRVVMAPVGHGENDMENDLASFQMLLRQSADLVTDDRFFNRHSRFDWGQGATRIRTTTDLLQMLADTGRLPVERVEQIATELRRRGMAFVPVRQSSLVMEMDRTQIAAPVSGDTSDRSELRETGELRFLRRNVRQLQAHGWFDPEFDAPWLLDFQGALVGAIKAQWREGVTPDLARARSNWLYRLLDSYGWSESQVGESKSALGEYGAVLDLSRLASSLDDIDPPHRQAFADWFKEDVVEPLWLREPRLRRVLLDHLRGLVRAVARDVHAEDGSNLRFAAAGLFHAIPSFLQMAMLEDTAFQNEVGYAVESRAEMGNVSFMRSDLLDHARKVYSAPSEAIVIADEQGNDWTLTTDPKDSAWPLLLDGEQRTMRLRGLAGIHPDPAARIAMLDKRLEEASIALGSADTWRWRLREAPLEADDIDALEKFLGAFPPMVVEALEQSFADGSAPISLLVPTSATYWEYLAGPPGTQKLSELARDWQGPSAWSSATPVERARWSLLLASHARAVSEKSFDLAEEQWRELGAWVLSDGDVLALTGFVERALPHASGDPALEEQILEAVARIETLSPDDEAGPLYLFTSLAIFVEGELSRAGTLAAWPPWHRRMAAMAHAALLARGTSGQIDTSRFARFCLEERGWRYALQTLTDMRLEPRWRTEYMSAAQMRHEFMGRIHNAAAALPKELLTPRIESSMLAETDSLRARLGLPMALLPGPLEGAIHEDLQAASGEFVGVLEQALEENGPKIELARNLIGMEAHVRLPQELCSRASIAIREEGVTLLSALPQDEVHAYLVGLGNFAASHRLPELAQTIQWLVRLQHSRKPMSIAEEMQVLLHAAAAHEDAENWQAFVGQWTREMAYRIADVEDARSLFDWLGALCDIEPKLRAHTGRARAVLQLLLDA